MRPFLQAIIMFVSDLAATLLFLILYAMTHNAVLSVCLGMSLGLLDIAVRIGRKKPVDGMQWLSLVLVIASGSATFLTNDPRFILFKPSAIYVIVGVAMLRPGWMTRYLPPIAKAVASDIATYVGFAWAGLMFISAMLNAYLAVKTDLPIWALTMALFGIASKVILFVSGFAAIRLIVRYRLRAMPLDQRQALLMSTGWQAKSSRPATSA
jgi:intracellular septation protein A